MDAKSYCDRVNNQLTGWKASIYDTILSMEKLDAAQKNQVQPHIEALNKIVMELNRSLEDLRTQCPADWSPQKQTIEAKISEMRQNFEQISEKIDSLLPDTTAWV